MTISKWEPLFGGMYNFMIGMTMLLWVIMFPVIIYTHIKSSIPMSRTEIILLFASGGLLVVTFALKIKYNSPERLKDN